jgi:3-hydroxyisobutyrate dehydrogenase-like beta-hydroxyacid dehydrogenase
VVGPLPQRRIGFVGLGAMGAAMAANLVGAGLEVVVWNRSPEPVAALVARGAVGASNRGEALGCPQVFSVLADDAAVRDCLLDDTALSHAAPDSVHVNMATISPELAVEIEQTYRLHGLRYVAAPVFGRVDVATAGNLTVVAGGESSAIDEVQPIFDILGQRTWRISERPADANLVKVLGNYLIASTIAGLAEITTVAEAAGLDPTALTAVLTENLFSGLVHKGYGAMISRRNYEPVAFRLQLGLKDVELARSVAAANHVPVPIGDVLRDAFMEAIAHGQADDDWAAVTESTRRAAGLA